MNQEKKGLFLKQFQQTPQTIFEASSSHCPNHCILDTNVILDLWVFKDAQSEPILKALENGTLRLIGHAETFCELADVLSRQTFRLSEDTQKNILNLWLKYADIVTQELSNDRFCRDQDDDKFFALARLSQTPYLVSKDKKVLKARGKAKKFGTKILRLEEFCSILNSRPTK